MKFWEIIVVSVLIGPLVTTGLGLFYCLIRTGIRDLIWGQVPNSLIINANRNDPEFKKYVEELEKIGKNRAIKKIVSFFLGIIKIIAIILLFFLLVLIFVSLPH